MFHHSWVATVWHSNAYFKGLFNPWRVPWKEKNWKISSVWSEEKRKEKILEEKLEESFRNIVQIIFPPRNVKKWLDKFQKPRSMLRFWPYPSIKTMGNLSPPALSSPALSPSPIFFVGYFMLRQHTLSHLSLFSGNCTYLSLMIPFECSALIVFGIWLETIVEIENYVGDLLWFW